MACPSNYRRLLPGCFKGISHRTLPFVSLAHPRACARSAPLLQRPLAAQQKLQQQTGAGVVQLYRYPGLTQSKAKTLLRKVSV